jgi:hypothetical protein
MVINVALLGLTLFCIAALAVVTSAWVPGLLPVWGLVGLGLVARSVCLAIDGDEE